MQHTRARSASRLASVPMTLGNMRRNGVRSLSVYCPNCRHSVEFNVDHMPDDVEVPSIGPRMVCTRAALSAQTPDRIGEICGYPHDRFVTSHRYRFAHSDLACLIAARAERVRASFPPSRDLAAFGRPSFFGAAPIRQTSTSTIFLTMPRHR
jgi:hypothetical protein